MRFMFGKQVQSTLVISTSLISNNRLSRSENQVPVLTEIYQQATKYFQYISNLRVKYIVSMLKVVVRLIVFLSSANLICRGTDILKCFIESLGHRDNESRLYFHFAIYCIPTENFDTCHSWWRINFSFLSYFYYLRAYHGYREHLGQNPEKLTGNEHGQYNLVTKTYFIATQLEIKIEKKLRLDA